MADLIVCETTCDGKKKMFELIAGLRPLHVMDLPQMPDEDLAIENWRHMILRLKDFLEKETGRSATIEQIENALQQSNKKNRLIRKIFEYAALNPPVISWKEIYEFIRLSERSAELTRTTAETDIRVRLNVDGTGKSRLSTGLGFFDHMLEQIARHGNMDLEVEVRGDLEVDEHHTIEDTAIVLGEAFAKVLADKRGMERYGFTLPMDDCLAQVAIDFGGRSWLVWEADFKREKIGDMPTEMFYHFFKSFSDGARANLNIKAEGRNEHHKIEAIFKALAKAIRAAVRRDPEKMILPSTKGML